MSDNQEPFLAIPIQIVRVLYKARIPNQMQDPYIGVELNADSLLSRRALEAYNNADSDGFDQKGCEAFLLVSINEEHAFPRHEKRPNGTSYWWRAPHFYSVSVDDSGVLEMMCRHKPHEGQTDASFQRNLQWNGDRRPPADS